MPLTDRWSATSPFTLRRGQVLALLGSSGCGKSLTCAAALGLLPPGVRQTAGRVLLDGIPVHGEQLRGATIATIMQNPRSAFNPLQTMAAHARETCRAAGRETNDAVLLAAMEEVGLDNPRALLKRYPFEMSGGMLQRMMVALALLSRAPFIIADEPTTDHRCHRPGAHPRPAGGYCRQARSGTAAGDA